MSRFAGKYAGEMDPGAAVAFLTEVAEHTNTRSLADMLSGRSVHELGKGMLAAVGGWTVLDVPIVGSAGQEYVSVVEPPGEAIGVDVCRGDQPRGPKHELWPALRSVLGSEEAPSGWLIMDVRAKPEGTGGMTVEGLWSPSLPDYDPAGGAEKMRHLVRGVVLAAHTLGNT